MSLRRGPQTETVTAHAPGSDAIVRHTPVLFVLLSGRAPRAGASRHSLADIDVIEIGGGAVGGSFREGRRLRVVLPDRRVSSEHARIEAIPGGFVVRDRESKNGTFVDGERVDRALLGADALLGVGETLLQVRTVEHGGALEPDFAPASDPFATLLPGLAARHDDLQRVAASSVPVLLQGETGVGKDLVAQAIHARSGRSGELVAVNCAALPAALVEAELFGHERGAFSGATERRDGLVRAADRGTLFLDEIAELPAAAQATLLRTLQGGEVRPVGSARATRVDVRVICATHRDLAAMVEAGTFRADLYARIAGFVARLPALRERRCDLGLLVRAFFERRDGPLDARIGVTALLALMRYDWPYNVRELMQALEHAMTLAPDGRIGVEHLPTAVVTRPVPTAQLLDRPSEARETDDAELRERLRAALASARGNVSVAARAMGAHRRQVQRWLQRFGLDPERFRG